MRGVLGTAPWLRAPLLLLRRPAVLLAVAGACLVLGVAAAVPALFLSSAGNAAFDRQVESQCDTQVGPRFGDLLTPEPGDAERFAGVERSVEESARRYGVVRRPVLTLHGNGGGPGGFTVTGAAGPATAPAVTLLSRTGVLDAVEVLTRADAPGLWLSDNTAEVLRVRAGDTVLLRADRGGQVPVPVGGTFRDQRRTPPDPYWCSNTRLAYAPGFFSEYTPPALALADRAVVEDLGRRLDLGLYAVWELPLRDGVRLPEARALAAVLPAATSARDADTTGRAPQPSSVPDRSLERLIERSGAVVDALGPAVVPIATAGIGVALALVAAAGSLWVDRRRREVVLLSTRGVGPAALGVKAALEMAAPAVLGALLGAAVAAALVSLLGPSQLLDPAALRGAAAPAGAAGLGSIVALATVAAVRSRRLTERPLGGAPGRARLVPWELAFLAAAYVVWRDALDSPRIATGAVAAVDLRLLVFPLLALLGVTGLALRVTSAGLPGLRRWGSRRRPPVYLATRRVTGAPSVALVLVAAAALPVGVLVYADALTRSAEATLAAKLQVLAGSDVAVGLVRLPEALPPALRGRATVVTRAAARTSTGREVAVLGVDRATFADAADWHDEYADAPLEELLAAVDRAEPGEPLRAVVVAGPALDAVTLRNGTVVPLRVADTAAAFPGLRNREPLVVVDRSALAAAGSGIGAELWARGSEAEVLAAVRVADLATSTVLTGDRVLDSSGFLAITWTFGLLQALGGLIGLVGLGGLLLHLETRARAQVVATALTRRMGLSRASSVRSLVLELGSLLGLGLVVGVGTAYAAARAVYARLDAAPDLPPLPLLPLPVLAVTTAVLTTVAVTGLASALAQRTAERADVGEVLRRGQ